MFVVFHRRRAAPPFTTASGTASSTARSKRSRIPAPRASPAGSASHAAAASAATPAPTIPATFSVPPRRSRSCGPPITCGSTRTPARTQRIPTPFGPWNLCADAVTRSTGRFARSVGMRPTHCVASQWKRTPRARQRSPTECTGCRTPVSLFAPITLTSATSPAWASSAASSASRSTTPSAPAGTHATRARPRASRDSQASRTALCSVRIVTTVRGPASASSVPPIASEALSVPPPVKTTSRGCAPRSLATDSRASSTECRASIPARCRLDGLPQPRTIASVTAATTSGSGRVVALQSRYARIVHTVAPGPARGSAAKATRAPGSREPAQCG